MFPSFVKRLSSSFSFGKNSNDKGDNSKPAQESSSRRGTEDDVEDEQEIQVLRRQDTHELAHEGDTVARRSSRTQAVESVKQATRQLSWKTSRNSSRSIKETTKNESRRKTVERTVTRPSSNASSRDGDTSTLSRSSLSRSKTGSLSKKTSSASNEHGSIQAKSLSKSKNSASSIRKGIAPELLQSSLSGNKTGSLSMKTSAGSSEHGGVQRRNLSQSKRSVSRTRETESPNLLRSSLSRNRTRSLEKKTSSLSSEHGSFILNSDLSETRKSVSSVREREASEISRAPPSRKRTLSKKTSSLRSENESVLQTSDLSKSRSLLFSTSTREATEPSLNRKRTISLTKKTSSVTSESGGTIKKIDLSQSRKSLSITRSREASETSRAMLSRNKTGSLSKKSSSVSSESESLKKRNLLELRKSLSDTRKNLIQSSSNHQGSSDASTPETSKKKKKQKELWFPRGACLAVKADDDDDAFYLCRSLYNVYSFTKQVPVKWLVNKKLPMAVNVYHLGYQDTIEIYSILMQVDIVQLSHTRFFLPFDVLNEINRLLKLSADVEEGNMSLAELEDDVEPIILSDEPPAKKPRLKKTDSQKLRDKEAKLTQKKQKSQEAGGKKKVASKSKGEGQPKKRKVTKSQKEIELHPRDDIKILEKDPLFETREDIPYISKVANASLIYRAIYLQDNDLLKELLTDGNTIYSLYTKSLDTDDSPLTEALKCKNTDILDTVMEEHFGEKFRSRVENNNQETNMLSKLDTGSYNDRSLGIPFIRKIAASRGCREGNNAFLKEEKLVNSSSVGEALVHASISEAQYNVLVSHFKDENDFITQVFNENDIPALLLSGKNELVGKVVEHTLLCHEHYFFGRRRKSFNRSYTQIYRDVVLFKDEELKNCAPSVVGQVLKSVQKLSPFHFAAANPNSKYLKQLLSVQPEVHITDKSGRSPIHYAAGCSSNSTLNLLLDWGANPSQTDSSRRIPLHYAVEANRPDNVRLLLEDGKKRADDVLASKFGVGGVNKRISSSSTPLHIAAERRLFEVCKILLEYGADVNAKLSIAENSETPLMKAAAAGDLKIVRLLVEHGAVVEQKDRMGRTSVIHSCKNGSTNVLSYLLNIGANGERADNSGNAPLHYAAAYGWFFTVRLLLEAGASANISNMWKMTPIAVAYLKGHPGIVHELLNRGGADLNSPNDYGMTMIFHACSSDLRQTDLCEQIRYMVEEKGALCTLKDHNKRTPLHHLADMTLPKYYPKEAYVQSVAIADLLVRNGCELNAVDDKGSTAVMLALAKMKNYPLAEFLIKKGCHIRMPPDGNPTTTILHKMAKNMWSDPLSLHTIIDLFKIHKHMDTVKSMAKYVDDKGYTPLLRAVKEIQTQDIHHYDDVTELKKQRDKWEAARKFITILIRDLDADINAKVEKAFTAVENEAPHYWWDDASIAHRAAVHLALTGNDPAFDESHVITAKFSGELFKSFINLGANVNVYDNSGLTPLATCIDYKYTELMDFLFSNSDCDFNIATNNGTSKLNPLIYAVKRNKTADILNKLIDLGCDINCVGSDQNKTFLHELITAADHSISKEDKLKVIEKLAEKKYDFNIADLSKNTALHFAVCGNSGAESSSYELEVRLLQLGADAGLTTWENKTALHYVFYKGPSHPVRTDPAELTKLLCRSMTKEQINMKDKYGKTALHYASICGATTCCMYLLMIGADVNIQDNDGNTPLACAIGHSQQGCATLFIQNGANLKVQIVEKPVTPTAAPVSKPVKQKVVKKKNHSNEESESSDSGLSDDDDLDGDNDKITGQWVWKAFSQEKKADEIKIYSLYQASIERNLSGVAMFITDAGCDRSGLTEFDAVNIAIKTYKYKVALHLICTTTDLSVLRQTGDNKQNLLHILTLSCEHLQNNRDDALIKVGEALIKAGVPVNAGDKWNCTPLLYAVINRHSALAGILLEKIHDYDENYQDGFKRTYLAALFWRCHSRKMGKSLIMDFISKLLGHIRVNAPIYLPLNTELASIEHQEKNCDPDIWKSYPESKTSALILSVICGDLWLTRTILEQAVDPNIPDGNKITPLMHAVIQNKPDYVRVLLNYSYDPDQEAAKKAEQSQQQAVAASHSWNMAGMFHFTNMGGSVSTASTEANRTTLHDSVVSDKTKDQQIKGNEEDEEFTTVQKTSPVNLNAKDSRGRTVLHYVAKPLPTGTYDNAEIAYVLAKAGARMMKDSAGFNPYELAVMSGASKVAAVFKKHYKLTEKDKKHLPDRDFPVHDKLPDQLMDLPDYKAVAEYVLRQSDTDMEIDDTYCHEVNENCNVVNGELVKDEELGIVYDALMTIVDVKQGDWGLYNFYQMQLIHQASKNLYILFTRWGRIQDKGQFQHTPFSDKAEAVKHFIKLFKEKTGNAWENIKSFERKPGRYRLVEDAARKAPAPQSDIHFKLRSKCKSHLPRHLYKVIKTLMDPKVMQMSMNNSWGISTESLPFGQLHKERLMQGMQILETIEKLLNEAKTLRSKKDKEEIIAFQNVLEKISELSNDYFHVVPQKEYVYEKIKPLDKQDRLKHQINMVKNLLDYEIVCKMLLAAMHHRKQFHPVDYVYRCLDCKMELMSQDDAMTQMILKYIWTGTHRHDKACVSGIYKLAREGESDRLLATGLKNRCLLWHGSNKTNLLSIFSRGLVVSPPEARSTGSLYGQGIYFSDSFYKSSSYMYQRDSDMHFMLLCEVALGEIKYHADNEQVSDKDTYNSLVVLGNESYAPTSWLILPSGVSIPHGMMQNIRERRSQYSEYVVKDPAQVCLRYLVMYSR